jgi:hypothetical protein
MRIGKDSEFALEVHNLVPPCPPEIPHELNCDQTHVALVIIWQLSEAWHDVFLRVMRFIFTFFGLDRHLIAVCKTLFSNLLYIYMCVCDGNVNVPQLT